MNEREYLSVRFMLNYEIINKIELIESMCDLRQLQE